MYLEHLVTLTSQVASAIAADYRPSVEPVARAYRLVLVSVGTHMGIASDRAAGRRMLASWPNSVLANLIVDAQRALCLRLVEFLVVADAVHQWCDELGKPAFEFWSWWEAPHAVHTALTQPSFPKASQLVQEYALNVATHLDAWQVALPRFSELGAAVLHRTGPGRSRLQDRAFKQLLSYMPRKARADWLPAPWAGWDQRLAAPFAPAGKRARPTDASQEQVVSLLELLDKIRRQVPLTERLARALDRADDYVPNQARLDFLNRLETYRRREEVGSEEPLLPKGEDEDSSAEAYAERHRRVTEPGGKDRQVWTPEVARQQLGEPPDFDDLRELCMTPPPDFLETLPPAERRAFEALCDAVLCGTLPREGGILQAIAQAANVSSATVTRLVQKIRALLQP